MTELQRKILRLYKQGKLMREIAEACDTTIGTVNGILNRLRKQGLVKKNDRRKGGVSHRQASNLRQQEARAKRRIIKEARQQGMMNREISEQFDIPLATVDWIASQLIKAGEIERRTHPWETYYES